MAADAPELRASDEDRERAAAALGVHYAAGRLDQSELDQRLKAAYAARDQSQLQGLLADLPALPPGELELRREFNARRRQLRRRMLQESGGGLAPFVVCTVIWAASGASGFFWPVFVLLAVLVPLIKGGWALYGPAPDLDRVEAEFDRDARRRVRRAERHARRAERHGRSATGRRSGPSER